MKICLASIALLALILLVIFGAASWTLYSESGTDWLLTRLGSATGMRIEKVEGNLLGRLRLQSLQREQPEMAFACDSIEMVSRLSGFFPLQLHIERLQVTGLTLVTQPSPASSEPSQMSWPELPWWTGLLEIELQQLSVTEVFFRQAGAERTLERLAANGRWKERRLQISALELRTPDLKLAGAVTAAFDSAALKLELQADNRQPQQPWQRLRLWLRLWLQGSLAATDRLLLSGPVSLEVADPAGPWLSIAGELALAREELWFQSLQLKSMRRTGSLLLSGKLNFASTVAGLSSRLQLQEIDLQPEVGKPLRLSGDVVLKGNLDSYHGHFALASRAEQPFAAQLAGKFSGDQRQLQVSELTGDWLQGRLNGNVQADWQAGWHVSARLDGRELDPGQFHDRLQGQLNFSLRGEVGDSGQGPVGQLLLTLNDAILQQQPLNGQLKLQFEQGAFEVADLNLQGVGFWLQGQGALADQVEFSWQAEQLEKLLAGVQGRLHGVGHLTLTAEGLKADFSSRGAELQYGDLNLENWQLQGEIASSQQVRLTVSGHNLRQVKGFSLQDIQLAVRGTVPQHVFDFRFAQSDSSLSGELGGGWDGSQWQGNLSQLIVEDGHLGQWRMSEPALLQLSTERLQIGRLQLVGPAEGTLLLHGSYLPPAQQGQGQLTWKSLDLSLLNPWLDNLALAGVSSGDIALQQTPARLQGQVSWHGELKTPRQSFRMTRGDWRLDWGATGLLSQLELLFADGSRLDAELSNEERFAMLRPQQLQLRLRGEGLNLQSAQPWLPPGLTLTGGLNLQADGFWNLAQTGQLSGTAEMRDARLSWQEDDELIGADLTSARLLWQWQEQLSAQLELQVEERGNIDASIHLPLVAAFPLKIEPQQKVHGELTARLHELGLLSVLFPGRVQESSGQLKLDLQLDGIWQQPQLQGDIHLFDCRAYLAIPGIQLQDVELRGRFDEQRFSLTSLQVRSGDGTLSGTGEVQLANWQPQKYRLKLGGSNFQLLNLPELQAEISPDLAIEGDLKQVNVKGHLLVPRLLVSGKQKSGLAENSPDLVIVDAPEQNNKPLRIQPQLDLQLQLGEKVLLKTAGIDARLEGELRMESTPQQVLAAFGEIRVAKGRYASYGVNLDINRGNLIFNGGPISQPLLDILASRTAGEVKAGVQVTGTPKRPVVKLYSEPSLPEIDILSYIVLGRPAGAQGSQSGVLMTAAGALLSQGESVVLQEKLKDKLGLDVLDINAGNGDTRSSVITTGKYLRPDLYVSFGYSLFNNSNEVKLRYTLSPRWEVESNFGTESGADLFYKIDLP